MLSALALLYALMLWRRTELTPAIPPASTAQDAAATDAPALSADPPELALRTSPSAAGSGAAMESAERTEVPAELRPNARPLEIHVVAKGSGAPVAGAEVFLADLDGQTVSPLFSVESPEGFESRYGASSTRSRTDASGLAVFEPPRGYGAILARTEHAWGYRLVHPRESSRYWIEIVSDGALDVEVVDVEGHPVQGIGVRLCARSSFHCPVGAPTAADGIARFPHAGFELRRDPNVTEWRAALAIVAPEPPSAPFDLREMPSAPLRLVAPPLGEVEIDLIDLDGETYASSARVWLRVAPPHDVEEPKFSFFFIPTLDVLPVDGRYLTRAVGLGLEVQACATFAGGEAIVTACFAGPRSPAERARVQLQRGAGMAIAEFRALDDRAQPMRACTLRVARVMSGLPESSHRWSDVTTDDAGVLRSILDPSSGPGGQLRIVHPTSGAFGTVEIPIDLSAGRHVLGDVVLAGEPVLVAGIVRDDLEEPIPGAMVIAFGRTSSRSHPSFSQLRVDADAQGRFAIRGSIQDPKAFTIGAAHAGHASARAEVAPGVSDLVLVLPRAGEIRGSVRSEEERPVEGLRIDALLGGECLGLDANFAELGFGTSCLVRADGRFALERLAPGTYDVRLAHAGTGASLFEVSDVVVRAGEVSLDPRLEGIDLGGAGRTIVVRVTDLAGAAIQDSSIRWRPARSQADLRNAWSRGGVARITLGRDAIELVVGAAGFSTVRRNDVHEDVTVELPPALRVRLVLPATVDLPEPPFALEARLVAEDGEDVTWFWPRARIGAARDIVVLAPSAGSYRVEWEVVRERPAGTGIPVAARAVVEELHPTHIDVPLGSGEHVVDVRIDVDALARALAEVQD